MFRCLLVGPPNVGKTTLFNAITGRSEKTGNFHGVTATVSSQTFKYKDSLIMLSDLPGIYNLSPYSLEEQVSVKELKSSYDVIFCVIEAIYPLAGIKLLKELKCLNKPIIAVITKTKMHTKRGGRFDLGTFSLLCGVRAVAVESENKKSVNELMELFLNKDFTTPKEFNCEQVVDKIYTPFNRGNLDKLLLKPFWCFCFCVLMFSLVMVAVFSKYSLVYNLSYFLELGFKNLTLYLLESLIGWGVSDFVVGVLQKGLDGTMAVLGFIPQLVALNFFLMLIEESGIVGRYSLFLGKGLGKVGLSGRSIFPILSSFGCTALSCKLTNSAECEKIKNRTLCSIPFVPCSAKNAVFIFVCTQVFSKPILMLVVIYSLCLVLTWLNAYIAQKVFPTNYSSSVCELAPFVLPSFKKALKFSLNSLTSFIKKIIVSVFLVGIGIGILSSITLKLDYTVDLQESILGFLGKKLAIVFKPIGLGDWRIVVSLLCGLLAKENTLGVLEILYQGNISFGCKQALCFITYFALYPPCVMALGCVQSQKKGLGVYLVIKHLILGYIGALFVYIILTKGVLFSIIMLGIIFGCVAIYEIYYCKRQRKTFTHCRKGRCRVCSMPKATTQKGYKGQRQKNE